MYYAIDETAARIAHNMNSFYVFQQGKVTEEYRKLVDAAAALAAEKKNCVDSMFHAKIDALLDAYSRKLADWYNKGLAIESRCPSVMIAGPSNFPIRKKEKQNAARDKHMRDYERIKALLTKIAATGTGSIRSDDPDALAKLKSKRASIVLGNHLIIVIIALIITSLIRLVIKLCNI